MNRYTRGDIHEALAAVGQREGDLVLMHSALWPLGQLAHVPPSAMPDALLSSLVDFFGPEGTIVVPAFSYRVCRSLVFDRAETQSEGMGVLSETLRMHPDARRSAHPLQSVAALGRWAGDICARDPKGAFNPGGPFDGMVELDAQLLLFGASMQAAALIHLVEERCEVVYRYWKTFTVACREGDGVVERDCCMFVRDLEANPQLDLSVLSREMEREGTLRRAPLGAGEVVSCSFADLCATATRMLKRDPLVLLENREAVARFFGITAGEAPTP